MALSDFIQRLNQISGQGSRETDFQLMRGKRSRDYQAALNDLRLQAQRNMQFQGNVGPNQYTQSKQNPGGFLGGNGKFDGKFSNYPLMGKLRVTSPYGVERKGHKVAHTGIDWGAAQGTPIYAPGDATVRQTAFNKIYGNQTILDFGGGYSAMFGHQSKFGNIKPGQQVHAGDIIGYVGSTGWSTGPHLHFETWINNKPVNPLSWFM